MKSAGKIDAKPYRVRPDIDYTTLVALYNAAEVGAGVELEKVYNITLFKRALARRGVVEGVDFNAFNAGEVTLVTRLTTNTMA